MTLQTGQQIVAIQILPNISRNKSNETMTFGQLIEYNMKTIFLEKPCAKCDAKAIVPDSFIKIKFEHVSW